jgi:hypothetical protein
MCEKEISTFNKYLLENYEAISISQAGIKKVPLYDQRAENIYLMELFKFRPDNLLLDAMMNDSMLSQKVRELLLSLPDSDTKLELLEDCFPKGDTNFEKKFIRDIKMFNESGTMSKQGIEAMVNPMPYSYIDRTKNTMALTVATQEYYVDIFKSFMGKEIFSKEDAEIFIGLEQSCDLMDIAKTLEIEQDFIEKIAYANRTIEISNLREKDKDMLSIMQKLYNEKAQLSDISAVQKENPIETLASLRNYYNNIGDMSEKLNEAIKEYVKFRNDEYAPMIGVGKISEASVAELLSTNALMLGIKLQEHDFETENKIVENLNNELSEKLISLTEMQYETKSTTTNPFTPMGQKLLLEQQNKLKELYSEIDTTIKAFVSFRNELYNPAHNLGPIGELDVTGWLNLYIDKKLDEFESIDTIEKYFKEMEKSLAHQDVTELEYNIISAKKELDALLTLPPEKLFENLEKIAEQKKLFTEITKQYIDIVKDITEDDVNLWLEKIKSNGYEYEAPQFAVKTADIADDILDGDEKLEVPTTSIDDDIPIK